MHSSCNCAIHIYHTSAMCSTTGSDVVPFAWRHKSYNSRRTPITWGASPPDPKEQTDSKLFFWGFELLYK